MKKAFLLLLLPTTICAQDKDAQYIFKTSPQHLVLNMLKVGVERLNNSQTKSFSLYLFGAANHRSQGYISFPYSGVGAEIQARRHLNTFSNNTKGQSFSQSVYLAGFAQGGVFRWTNTYTDQTNYQYFDKNIAAGFAIGLQRTFWKVLVIDMFAGGGFQKGWSKASPATPIRWTFNNDRFSGPGYTGILPKVGLQIGVAL